MVNNLYVIGTIAENHFCNMFDPKEMTIKKWHIFLGNPSPFAMKHMKSLSGMFIESVVQALENCEVCMKAK